MPGYIPKIDHPKLNRALPISRGIVGIWPMVEKGSADIIYDYANALNGSKVGTVSINDTPWGKGRLFPATTSQNYTIPVNPLINFGDGITDKPFSVFILYSAPDANNRALIGKDQPGTTREWMFRTVGGSLYFFLFDQASGGTYIGRNTNAILVANTWYSAIATYNGSSASSGVKIYLNAVKVDTTDAASGSYIAMNNTGLNILIGEQQGFLGMNGTIAASAIWNRELTQNDVSLISHNPFAMFQQTRYTSWMGAIPTGGTLGPIISSKSIHSAIHGGGICNGMP